MAFLALLPLLVFTSASAQLLKFDCSNNVTYEPNSLFGKNLQSLLNTLSIETPRYKGFNKTVSGNRPNQVNGRALCRGDTTPAVCKSCLQSAGQEIQKRCQTQEAIIWFDKCQIEYSYGPLQDSYAGRYPDSNSPIGYNLRSCYGLTILTDKLQRNATSSESMYASGNMSYANETLYGLVQCTRDVSQSNCNQCLKSAFEDLDACHSLKGGAVLSSTCSVRVVLDQFYSSPHGNRRKLVVRVYIAVAVGIVTLVIVLIGLYAWCSRRRARAQEEVEIIQSGIVLKKNTIDEESCGLPYKDLPFMEFSVIKAATDNFSELCKLGQGGFGTVYKGVLPGGKEIAVKRLSRRSWQGSAEFMNEIKIIAKLQHRNLVRLLCCAMEGSEKLLIYEYMPNKSLDIFLFDDEKSLRLDWKQRINIITGIARGLFYLHEESRLKIVHRDLKPSNVLLDDEMSAKISDFGMARIFGDDQKLGNTKRVVGTYGYMAPEYAMGGVFSAKSDVFSFGVMLLEIISGKRRQEKHEGQTLLAYALRVWNEGREIDLVDPRVREGSGRRAMEDVGRYVHIGLLCVQEDPSERPAMSEVLVLLETRLMSVSGPARMPALPVGVDQAASVNLVTVSTIAPR